MPTVKKDTTKTVVKKTTVTKKSNPLSVPVLSLVGGIGGTLNLPKEIFGQKINEALLTQAVRVYSTNLKALPASTKTRGEVEGSTAKIYRQKGTGRARHGSIRAPIFVGGGIVFGPRFRKVRLDLPKKMKKAALLSALSAKVAEGNITGISGIEKISGKTKQMVEFLMKLNSKIDPKLVATDKKSKLSSILIITGKRNDNLEHAVANIPKVNTLPIGRINAFEVIRHELLLISKDAAEGLVKTESEVG